MTQVDVSPASFPAMPGEDTRPGRFSLAGRLGPALLLEMAAGQVVGEQYRREYVIHGRFLSEQGFQDLTRTTEGVRKLAAWRRARPAREIGAITVLPEHPQSMHQKLLYLRARMHHIFRP
jgi:hypothetical protein